MIEARMKESALEKIELEHFLRSKRGGAYSQVNHIFDQSCQKCYHFGRHRYHLPLLTNSPLKWDLVGVVPNHKIVRLGPEVLNY